MLGDVTWWRWLHDLAARWGVSEESSTQRLRGLEVA